MKKKKVVSLLLSAAMAFTMLGAAGCGSKSGEGDNTFSYWIVMTDGGGTYYDKYEDNPAVQWLNEQYWDAESHTMGTKDKGTNIQFTFQAPISGSEQDNYNTMISTGEYTDLMDLTYAGSKDALVNDGVLLDITEYVEKYMPDYVALLDANPEWKTQATVTDEDGKTHYYYIATLKDGPGESWDCFEYRRDWVVKYATPTEYVWDWDSEYVKENGHPAVTPLSEAQASGNMEGWKKNEVTSFQVTNDGGDNPNENYEDNVIFPSGTSNPITISDWEWMFEAFAKAIEERGWTEDSSSYGISIPFNGYFQTADLVSSFGGATGTYYRGKDDVVTFSGTSDNFKTFVECMNQWYKNGWLDKTFETRSGDMFFSINQTGCTQGKVGMWLGTTGTLGDTIRVTCADTADQKDAYVMGCALPINDVYGTDDQKYVEPDALYQEAAGPSGGIGVTSKIEEKSEEAIAALFTYLNWCYTDEGSDFQSFGLTQEQYESVEWDEDQYKEYGFTDGLYHVEEIDGVKTYVYHLLPDSGLEMNAFKTTRMIHGYIKTGHGDVDYKIDKGNSKVVENAVNEYGKYVNTGSMTGFSGRFTEDESELDGDTWTKINDYMNIEVPKMVKNGTGNWDTYVDGLNAFEPEKVVEIYQKYVDESLGK